MNSKILFNNICKSQKNTFTTSLHSKTVESITTWSLICAVCLVYYHSLLKVQTDSQVLLSEVLLKCVISVVWYQCRFRSGLAIKTVSCSICCTKHQPLHVVWLHELAERGAEMGLSAPVVVLVKTSVTLSITLTSCSCVLVFFLGRCELFRSASAAKHTNTTTKLILLILSIVQLA